MRRRVSICEIAIDMLESAVQLDEDRVGASRLANHGAFGGSYF